MSRNLKALGLAMVAALALSAVVASAAQAANKHHLTVGTAPAIITASDSINTVFSITEGEDTVECTTTLYEGTISATTVDETTVTPTYSGCTVAGPFGPINATVDVNHCAYVLKGQTDASGDAVAEVECGPEQDITITYSVFGAACVVHVTPQAPTGGVHYTQSGNNVSIKATVTGIKYHETDPGATLCPNNFTGTDGTLSGTVLAKGFKDTCGSGLSGTEKTTPGTHYNTCEGTEQKLELKENVT